MEVWTSMNKIFLKIVSRNLTDFIISSNSSAD